MRTIRATDVYAFRSTSTSCSPELNAGLPGQQFGNRAKGSRTLDITAIQHGNVRYRLGKRLRQTGSGHHHRLHNLILRDGQGNIERNASRHAKRCSD